MAALVARILSSWFMAGFRMLKSTQPMAGSMREARTRGLLSSASSATTWAADAEGAAARAANTEAAMVVARLSCCLWTSHDSTSDLTAESGQPPAGHLLGHAPPVHLQAWPGQRQRGQRAGAHRLSHCSSSSFLPTPVLSSTQQELAQATWLASEAESLPACFLQWLAARCNAGALLQR